MTPKEKARELYNIMYCNNSHPFNVQVRQESAKQCALIAVDECINILDMEGYDDEDYKIRYWQQVKTEIEKL